MFTSIDRGTSVDAYIVDTGIRTTHIEFGGRADRGYVARGLNESPDDNNGHGTHVASLVAGDTVGVAKEAEVISVKVLNADGYGDVSWIVDGLQWISDRVQNQRSAGYQPKAIINMSLGAAGVSYTLEDAIQALVDDVKIPVVAAAGNDNSDACSFSPARMASVITVGATTDNDRMASFSNYGSCVDMLAPGERILGAYGTGDDMYALISGTSQATPLVTGVLSRYMSSIDGPPPSPSFLKAYVTDTASANYITFTSDIENTTPNKLLYRACESMGSDLPNYRPTFPVNSNVSGSSNISIMYIVPVLNFIILLLSFIGVMFDGFSCLC
jgi:subtilisin family serine protease